MKTIFKMYPESDQGLRNLKSDAKIIYHWAKRKKKGESYSKGYVTIIMPVKKKGTNSSENIRKIESELFHKGITFDTGTDVVRNQREWHLDWSLSGAKQEDILWSLKNKKISFTQKNKFD